MAPLLLFGGDALELLAMHAARSAVTPALLLADPAPAVAAKVTAVACDGGSGKMPCRSKLLRVGRSTEPDFGLGKDISVWYVQRESCGRHFSNCFVLAPTLALAASAFLCWWRAARTAAR